MTQSPISHHEAEIDATLALLARAQPTEGLEQRIQLRLAEAGTPRRPWHAFVTSREIGISPPSKTRALAASLVAAAAVIAGVLLYTSHRAPGTPPLMHAAPAMNGFGAAGAIRIAPPAVKPALHTHARGAAVPSHARAAIGSHHKPLPSGVAVPHSPPPDPTPSPQ